MVSVVDSAAPSVVARDFLQRRVAMFGLTAGLLGLGFWTIRLATGLLAGYGVADGFSEPTMFWHLAASLVLLVVWAVNRTGERGRAFIHATDVGGLALSSIAYQLMGFFLPLESRPEFVMLLALTFGVFARAVYVPSAAKHTLLLCILIGIPLVAGVYVRYDDPLEVAKVTDETDVAPMVAFFAGVWWSCTTACATAASRVIYGLRTEVRKAQKLGQYVLERKLGQGGMGAVYEAHHAMLRRPTAVKLLLPDRTGKESLARFEREVQLTARLTHPNTITIFDYGRTPEGLFYYAMELLDGASLDVVAEVSGPMPAGRVLHIIEQVAGALGEAHGIGLIHRDIKPANVVLGSRGGMADFAKVLDFGLVKQVDTRGDAELTRENAITGTPMYMPPEAITDPGSVDARSDLYSLGAVAYFLLTGTHVFDGRTVVEICSKHMHSIPEAPSTRLGAPVPEDVEELVLACLEKSPATRPQSALDLAARARACAAHGTWTPDDASRWWSAHRAAVTTERDSLSVPSSGRTLEVDVTHRAA